MTEEQKQEETKITFEFTQKQIAMLWEMVDLSLKTGGVQNLPAMVEIVNALQQHNDKTNAKKIL